LGDLPGALDVVQTASGRRELQRVAPSSKVELFTSGSTGEPKRITKTVAQLESELALLATVWPSLARAQTMLATVSHQHIYGLLFRILLPLATGRAFEARIFTTPSAVVRAARRHSAVAWIGSPAQYKRLDAAVAGVAPEALVAVVSSGGLLDAITAARLEQWARQPAIEVYGSTESSGVAWRQQGRGREHEPWTALPNVEIRIGVDRRLEVRSPQAEGERWLVLGDQASLVATNRFELAGRLDRIVKIEEVRVSLDALEQAFCALADVDEARCVVLAGRRTVVGAAIVLSAAGRERLDVVGARAFERALRAALARGFERVAVPRRFRFVDSLPADTQGKIAASAIADLFARPRSRPVPAHELAARGPLRYPEVRRAFEIDEGVRFELYVPEALAVFDGHFPGAPVLPGVVQLLWASWLAREHPLARERLGFDGPLRAMKRIKFQRLIRPGEAIVLDLHGEDGGRQLRFRFQRAGTTLSSGTLIGG
jgi:acyl-coenzyme A synthetase/AMP-(fatty) acid ligase/3-hydroxymyristoyl/3-hydroxydecanoyl-(acyl carrier protein) dehydratase